MNRIPDRKYFEKSCPVCGVPMVVTEEERGDDSITCLGCAGIQELMVERDQLRAELSACRSAAGVPDGEALLPWIKQMKSDNEKLTARNTDVSKDRDGWKSEYEMFANAWAREIACVPRQIKTHLIDELVLSTRDILQENTKLKSDNIELKARLTRMISAALDVARANGVKL